MDILYVWVRNLIFCLCLLELLCHLVRSADYRRYIRFFGGLVILLLVFTPVAELFSVDASFDEALRLAFAQNAAYELQVSQEALAGLQNRKIEEAYKAELERQMKEIIKAHGQQSSTVDVTLEDTNGSPAQITQISIILMPQNQGLNVFEPDEGSRRRQLSAAEEIRSEIAAMYGVTGSNIHVSVKE